MIICKKLKVSDTISNISEWHKKCPPAKPGQWKNGRSAKTTAEIWLAGVPNEFENALNTLRFRPDVCLPEYVSKFDNYRGNGRNHDLILIDHTNKILVAVESKVDESFDKTIEGKIKYAENVLEKNPNSNALNRISDLRKAIFGTEENDQLDLRYQLLCGIAGTISEANNRKYGKAVFMVQVLKTKTINQKKYANNSADLDKFVAYLTKGSTRTISNGQLILIGNLPGNEFIPSNIKLYISKIEILVP